MNNALSVQNPPSGTPADQAARWFLLLQNDMGNAQAFTEWQQWMGERPEHRRAYEEIEDAWLSFEKIEAAPALPSAQELSGDDYSGEDSIDAWMAGQQHENFAGFRAWRDRRLNRQRRSREVRSRLIKRAAAVLAVVAVLGLWSWREHTRVIGVGTFVYQTVAGQQQVIELPDGSQVTLDAGSRLRAYFSAQRRELTLLRGEAYFKVHRDAQRPFVVRAGEASVTALGTAFNVRISADRTVVAVVEGKVEIATARPPSAEHPRNTQTGALRLTAQLAAGEAITYASTGRLEALTANETQMATGWLEGRRQYRNEPLRYVLADVHRYTGRSIELQDDAVGDLRFTGTLLLQNSGGWLQGLPVALPVKVSENADGSIVISSTAIH